MPPLASIDVGSNTIRLLIGEVLDDRIADTFYDRKITRLGNMLQHPGKLRDEAMDASLSVLEGFSSVIARQGVAGVKAVATSALREASNSDFFVGRVLDATGMHLEVISGRQEAVLTLKGILFAMRRFAVRPDSVVVFDMGGGSTEWIFAGNMRNAGPLLPHIEMGSIPVGVIKLAGQYIKTDPVGEDDMKTMSAAILPVLDDLRTLIGNRVSGDTSFIGTAGTFTTISSIDLGMETYSRERIHLHSVSFNKLRDMLEILRVLPLEKRKTVRGLEPQRADLIIPGLHFTISVMRLFGFDKLITSEYGLLEGVLLELKETFEKGISKAGEP
jgi:exopolyphosphatase / guanosine-5'-triphosphate,3'-diphosphate pyrophosphatase